MARDYAAAAAATIEAPLTIEQMAEVRMREYVNALVGKESSGNPYAKAKTSSALGLGQFVDRTWEALVNSAEGKAAGLTMDGRTDAAQSLKGVAILTRQNARSLERAGLPVTGKTAYLAHFLGPSGAIKLLKANPYAVAADLFPDGAAANKSVFYKNKGKGPARTVGELFNVQTKKFSDAPLSGTGEAGASPFSVPYIPPAPGREAGMDDYGNTVALSALPDPSPLDYIPQAMFERPVEDPFVYENRLSSIPTPIPKPEVVATALDEPVDVLAAPLAGPEAIPVPIPKPFAVDALAAPYTPSPAGPIVTPAQTVAQSYQDTLANLQKQLFGGN